MSGEDANGCEHPRLAALVAMAERAFAGEAGLGERTALQRELASGDASLREWAKLILSRQTDPGSAFE